MWDDDRRLVLGGDWFEETLGNDYGKPLPFRDRWAGQGPDIEGSYLCRHRSCAAMVGLKTQEWKMQE